jgi:hypothetical protein
MSARIAQSAVIVTLLSLVACSSTSTEVMPPTVNVSIGQQLIDLKRAKDSGALSQKEYEQQVRQLVDGVK